MATSRKIFLDSSIFLSFIDRTHLNHQKTVAILELLASQNYQLYTSDLAVFQSFNLIERDLGFRVSQEFLKAILDSTIKILYAAEQDLLFAFRFFKTATRKASLTEVITARLMEKHGIVSILTFDYWHNIAGTAVSNLISSPLSQNF